MNIKEKDFEELQSMCKYLYIGDHNSKYLCNRYKAWIDCSYNHCPFVIKPCEGKIKLKGKVVAKVEGINVIF